MKTLILNNTDHNLNTETKPNSKTISDPSTQEDTLYEECTLCPRNCRANRLSGEKGVCLCPSTLMVSRAALHMWEEPCISGKEGSGTVFFTGCNMHCIFCQNFEISGHNPYGKEISIKRLSEIFLWLQSQGANNINLVTPTHYIPSIKLALLSAKENGLNIPIVYNTSGYEKPESLKLLDGLVDIYLPDFKYMNSDISSSFSNAKDYAECAKAAIAEMVRQTGEPVFDDRGMMKKGVIVRHLVLPGHIKESKEIIGYLYGEYKDSIYISIMNQYTPLLSSTDENAALHAKPVTREKLAQFPELGRRVTKREYEKVLDFAISLGIKNGFTQEGQAAFESFIPSFKDCTGV